MLAHSEYTSSSHLHPEMTLCMPSKVFATQWFCHWSAVGLGIAFALWLQIRGLVQHSGYVYTWATAIIEQFSCCFFKRLCLDITWHCAFCSPQRCNFSNQKKQPLLTFQIHLLNRLHNFTLHVHGTQLPQNSCCIFSSNRRLSFMRWIAQVCTAFIEIKNFVFWAALCNN